MHLATVTSFTLASESGGQDLPPGSQPPTTHSFLNMMHQHLKRASETLPNNISVLPVVPLTVKFPALLNHFAWIRLHRFESIVAIHHLHLCYCFLLLLSYYFVFLYFYLANVQSFLTGSNGADIWKLQMVSTASILKITDLPVFEGWLLPILLQPIFPCLRQSAAHHGIPMMMI